MLSVGSYVFLACECVAQSAERAACYCATTPCFLYDARLVTDQKHLRVQQPGTWELGLRLAQLALELLSRTIVYGVIYLCCMQDRDASVKRLRAVAKSTAEKASKEKAVAAAQPLEASQRAVIRDLSLRVANLTRINNQLKEERERAQVTQFLSDVKP